MGSPPEILHVEDDEDEHRLFVDAVAANRLAVTVSHAHHARQAVERLNRQGIFAHLPLPALIVLDLFLPGLQGKTLLQIIRNAYGPRVLPVVVLTGSYFARDRADCEVWGISAYLIKPTRRSDMIDLVASLPRFMMTREPLPADGSGMQPLASSAEGATGPRVAAGPADGGAADGSPNP